MVLEGTVSPEEVDSVPPLVLEEMTVDLLPGRNVGGGNGGAPEEVLKGTQATPEGPTVMVEVTGVGRSTTVVEFWPLLVTVEISSVSVVITVERIVNVASSVYVVSTNVRVTVVPPSTVPVMTVASDGGRPGLPGSRVGMGPVSVPLGQFDDVGWVG